MADIKEFGEFLLGEHPLDAELTQVGIVRHKEQKLAGQLSGPRCVSSSNETELGRIGIMRTAHFFRASRELIRAPCRCSGRGSQGNTKPIGKRRNPAALRIRNDVDAARLDGREPQPRPDNESYRFRAEGNLKIS